MKLPEPEYISMQEAANKYGVSLEHLRWLAEELLLSVYVRASNQERNYAKILEPHWNVDTLEDCIAIILDKNVNPVTDGEQWLYPIGFSYFNIYIKPIELSNLERAENAPLNPIVVSQQKPDTGHTPSENVAEQSQEVIMGETDALETTNPDTPAGFIQSLRDKGESDEVIAVFLKEKFPDLITFEYMRLLDPKRVESWQQQPAPIGRPKQWFYVLRKKGQKILEDREKMTSSSESTLKSFPT